MNKLWLEFGFMLLMLLAALPLALFPLRKDKWWWFIPLPFMVMFVSLAYWHWGAWLSWSAHEARLATQQQVAQILKTTTPTQLIDRLKMQLQAKPNSARGWYLLGKLYASQQQWPLATEAFAKAHQLNPDDIHYSIYYGQGLWQLNQQHLDRSIKTLLADVLQKQPQQPEALAILAAGSFRDHDYSQAIYYWQRLLPLVPPQSKEAQMLHQAIAKAKTIPNK